jgi:hypothetical protein
MGEVVAWIDGGLHFAAAGAGEAESRVFLIWIVPSGVNVQLLMFIVAVDT